MSANDGQTETAATHSAMRASCVLTHSGLQLGVSSIVLVAAISWMPATWMRSQPKARVRSLDFSQKLSISLNSSDARELSLLPGIGPKLADRVVRHRDSHGPFGSVEDLLAVHGVGPKLLQSLRPWVHVHRRSAADRFDDLEGGGHDKRLARVAPGRLSD